MSKPTRRPGSAVYYAQRVIPQDLRATYGKREIWKTLDTPDPETAKPLERRQQTAWDEDFAATRKKQGGFYLAPAAAFRPLARYVPGKTSSMAAGTGRVRARPT